MCASPYVFDGVLLPCGKCVQCRSARTREWSARLMHELEYHNSAVFVTLTYDRDSCPEQLSKHDLQCYIKRLRKMLDHPIKYYAVGEYGEKRGRPHYHLILYGLDRCGSCICCKKHSISGPLDDCALIYNAWSQGIVQIGSVTVRSCRYVAKYIRKKLSGNLAEKDNRQQPFALQSQGLGRQWAIDHSQQINDTLRIQFDGHDISIPRYYRDKINLDRDKRNQLILRGYDKMLDYCKKIGIDLPQASEDFYTRIAEMLRYGRQREYNLKALLDINNKELL